MLWTIFKAFAALVVLLAGYAFYAIVIVKMFSPLRELPGPGVRRLFGNHLGPILDPMRSARSHQILLREFGRSMVLRGIGPWEERFFTMDPLSMSHILKSSTVYEKPWQSRRLITSMIGCGMLAAEGNVHKRQRRVGTPAFSIQNLRALVPIVFRKGTELRDRWAALMHEAEVARREGDDEQKDGIEIDVAMWISRATFDVIGLAGFDYHFNAIHDESNELFTAYKEMFEVAISQNQGLRTLIGIYLPIVDRLFPNHAIRTVNRAHTIINRVAGDLIKEKKRKIQEGKLSGKGYMAKDLLTLMMKSNEATDLPPEQRISDEDILHNINTFLFAGSDTTSLALTWTLLLLARNPELQTRLRTELLSLPELELDAVSEEEIESFHTAIADLPYLDSVCRESLRLIPPLHSSIRVATQDDVVPTAYPVMKRMPDGTLMDTGRRHVRIPKGTQVHVPVEAFNTDLEIWGKDAWEFNPDRWDNLPEAVQSLPGLYSNILTFSAGPRSCIGMRFSLIEMKTFLYILVSNFVFQESEQKVFQSNVVLTRPYISKRFKEGSQCPMRVTPYVRPVA